jgi:hypothetical protein
MRKSQKKMMPDMLTPLNLSPLGRKSFELWVLEMLVNNTAGGRKKIGEISHASSRKAADLVKDHYALMHSEN